MSTKLTATELAGKLVALQTALEDATTARQMLAESEDAITRLREEIGTDHPLVRALFAPAGEPLPIVPKRRRGYHRVQRALWLNVTMEWLRAFHRPVLASELAAKLKGTVGQCDNTVLFSRLQRLAKDRLCVRVNPSPGTGKLGVRWEAVEVKPGPIVQRHKGPPDTTSADHRTAAPVH